MAKRLVSSSLLAAVLTGASAQTQPQSPAEVLRIAQKGTGEVEQLRTALRGSDASSRVAVFVAMVESNNPSLVAIAINDGHSSSDVVLRDLAVRAAFRELKSLVPEPVTKLSAEVQANYQRFSAVRVEISEYQWSRGTFKGVGPGSSGVVGQVSAGQLTFTGGICQANLFPVEGTWAFEGNVSCSANSQTLRERMRVQIR